MILLNGAKIVGKNFLKVGNFNNLIIYIMNPEFNQIQVKKPNRNRFDLSHERKFSLDMGRLVPIMVQEVLPGDSFNVVNQQLIRFAPMLAPIMHKCDVYTHYFFVPNRILWSQWDEFISGNNGENPQPALPFMYVDHANAGSIADYLGLPVGEYSTAQQVQLLPFAAVNKVYNEFYRDQNLIEPLVDTLIDGEQTTYQYMLDKPPYRRAWEHDYFTSCLPWTQKGEEVLLTFDTEEVIPIEYTPNGKPDIVRNDEGAPILWNGDLKHFNDGGLYTYNDPDSKAASIDNSDKLSIDLSGSYLMSVNQLRQAMALQRWLELNARAGSRYIETILAHFGVKSDDARLQRPEYLGGGKSNVQFSEVLQMSQSDTTPQGTMAGHGINYGESHEFKSYHKEHGYIIGFMSIRPKTNYQQGLPRHFSKNSRFDYFWNILAHLGEQEVKNKELYVNHSDPDGAFGYLPRYSEYKYIPSTVHGDFTNSLDFWHMGRIFENEPFLNKDFIECTPTKRIFAVTDDEVHNIWCHLYQSVKATRPIPVFSTPLLNG